MKKLIFNFGICFNLFLAFNLKAEINPEPGIAMIPFWFADHDHFILQEAKLIQSKSTIKEHIKFGDAQVSIYPVPATDFIKIKTDDFNQYQLFDEKGVVYRKGWIDECETIERNSLPTGVYFLKLSNILGEVYYHRVIFN